MEGDFIKINEWLTPLSWLYGLGVSLRNWLFDIGLLKQKHFDIPVISVGNITIGGCGKTPHVEYIVRLLLKHYKVAVLSRGYKRKSCGYMLAGEKTTMPQIGDEPFQMKEKFPNIYVAVDKNRKRGIKHLTTDKKTNDVEAIILDDAYQHRYVKPGLNILLIDYHRIITYDKLLPAGRLREPKEAKERADVVIVTKCPESLKPIDFRVLKKALELRPYQELYFTSIAYKPLTPFYEKKANGVREITNDTNTLLFSGIASPEQIKTDLQSYCKKMRMITFKDHHQFTKADIEKINKTFESMPEPKVIITTEKDATRLTHLKEIPENIKNNLYVLPIEVKFKHDKQTNFNNTVFNFIKKKNYHPKSDNKNKQQ
jgi:tetraacyldisaccharide 4'-kinase